MNHNILSIPKVVKRKSLESLHRFLNQNYREPPMLLLDMALFFKNYDIGLAKNIIERARVQFPYHPGLKKTDENIQREFNNNQNIDSASLQQLMLVRDMYIRLNNAGQLVSDIDAILGRKSGAETSDSLDKFSHLNWDSLNRYLESYTIAESSVITTSNGKTQFPENDDVLLQKLNFCIENQKGFSFIRMGDGEGTLLSSNFQNSITDEMKLMIRTWWGDQIIDNESLFIIKEGLLKAIESANIIGTPDLNHQLSDFNIEDNRFSRAYKQLNELVVLNQGKSFVSAYANHSLFKNGSLDQIIKDPRLSVCVISGHVEKDVRGYFRDKYSVEISTYLEIPSEHKFLEKFGYSSDKAHYPAVYERICSELNGLDLTDKLFLIGAGVLGKYYCHIIKENGGIALDIGSVFDYMLGYATRKFFRGSK